MVCGPRLTWGPAAAIWPPLLEARQALERHLGEDAFATAYQAGLALGERQAVDLALRALEA